MMHPIYLKNRTRQIKVGVRMKKNCTYSLDRQPFSTLHYLESWIRTGAHDADFIWDFPGHPRDSCLFLDPQRP
jgi:hypothetical protein